MKKIVFITSSDIFDEFGNGGSRGSRKNYDLLVKEVGEDNVYLILLSLPQYKIDKNVKNILVIQQPSNNMQSLIACCFGCKKFMPYSVHKIRKYIDEINPDIVFFDGSVIGKLIRRKAKYKQIVFLHNVEADYSYNKVKHEGLRYYPAYIATLVNEKRINYADKVGCLNNRDAQIILERYGVKTDFYMPVTFADRFREDKVVEPARNRILFLGSYFGPNIDGIEWFIENVMTQLPQIQLDIVGKGFEVMKSKYENYDNVHVIGAVEETSVYYYSHKVVVMPIRYGAGMKVKTAEAMMYGRAIIATDEALEGYDVEGVTGIYRCNSKEDFIDAIHRALGEKDYFMGEVRELFLRKYETSVLTDTVKRILF